jgi:hypothetical protein
MAAMPPFLPGRELGRLFDAEAVRPLLERRFPAVARAHGAGLLGTGSDALGFDTPQSMDHHWGPPLWLFMDESVFSTELRAEIDRVLGDELPSLPRRRDPGPRHFGTSARGPIIEQRTRGPANSARSLFWRDCIRHQPRPRARLG